MAGKSKRKRPRRKALARKITRERGMSYDRMSPNRRGVTALSEINGRGAYEERYARTRRALKKGEAAMPNAKSWEGKLYRKQLKMGRTAAQARATVRMVKGAKRKAPKRRASGTRKSSGTRRASGTRKSNGYKPNLKRAGQRVSKADYVAGQIRKGRSNKQAAADWKLASGYYSKSRTAARKRPRSYGKGKYKALTARAGSKKKGTYFYRTKAGHVRKIPDHALLGYASARAMNQVYRSGTEAQRARLGKRLQALYDRREKASERAASRARKGTAWFSPNAGDETILELEEWQQMQRNASRKKRKTTKKRRATRNPRAGKRDSKGRFVKKRKAAKRKTTKRRKTTTRRKATASRRRKTTTRKRKTTRRKKKRGFAAMTKKARCAAARKGGRKTARKTRKPGRRRAPCKSAYKRNAKGAYGKRRTSAIKRRKSTAGRKKRTYKRNVKGAAYKQELKNAFKYGLIVTAGYLGHRVATNMLYKYGTSKIGYLNEGAIAPYAKLITGAVVAAVGVPLAVRALPKHAGVAAAGIAASFIHGLIVEAAGKMEQPALLEAVSAYPNAPGYAQYSGYGSYYEFSPHQVFDGYGEFYETQPVPGLEQAAANGYGNYGGQVLSQAAAGYGNLTQMYANQGVGEFYAYGAEGIGEYESAPAAAGPASHTYDGIHPNLNSAEQMLDVAEAAAGFGNNDVVTQAAAGFGDVPLQSTVDPMIRAMDIPDMPGGSRAGILAGGDGIFG